MNRLILLITFILSSNLIISQNLDDLEFGSDSTFDVVSWNIEWFAKEGQTTIDYVVDIVNALDADIIAIQEIHETQMFNQLVDELDDYNGYCVDTDYLELAYLYKKDILQVEEIFQIFFSNNREFPREPLVMKVKFSGEDFVLINNHLKCCGDGILNLDNEWDEETRRYDACNLLDEYINLNHPNDNVIVLGDLNDELTDDPENNVFQTFLDDPENYLFADMDIAEGSSNNWSYPTWPSHLDHIMITNELLDEFEHPQSDIQCIKIDEYLPSGWWEYENYVSDHRPVGINLYFESTGFGESFADQADYTLDNFPNPFGNHTTITFNPIEEKSSINIYNCTGKLIKSFALSKGQESVMWQTGDLPEGIYLSKLIQDQQLMATKKLVKIR